MAKTSSLTNDMLSNKLRTRNVGIDILRGLSILSVLLLHLNIHFGYANSFLKEILPGKLFSYLFWSGFYGVVVFFTLSGYLITNSIIERWGSLPGIKVKKFYWFRFSRIIPTLFSLLVILSILHLIGIHGFAIDSTKTSLTRAVFSALTFHTNWLEIQVGYLPANWDILWSISIEESFYLFFPLVCLFLKKEWHFAIVLALFLIVSPWARTQLYEGNELGDRNHLAFLDSIALGCMAALVNKRISIPRWLTRTFFVVGLTLVLMIFIFKGFVYKSGLVTYGLNITLLSIGISLILLWLKEYQFSIKEYKLSFLNWLRLMGRYSYEIYLTHMFVFILGAKLYSRLELTSQWLIPYSIFILFVSYHLGKLIHNRFSEPIKIWLRERAK